MVLSYITNNNKFLNKNKIYYIKQQLNVRIKFKKKLIPIFKY